MDEKLKEILDQYSLEILSVSRGRGAFLCQTGQGLKIVQEYHLSPERLVFESMVKYIIRDRGYVNIDQIVVNKEGELCSKNKYDRVFTVRDWYDGRECDMKSRSDLLEAAANLGRLHKAMDQVHLQGDGPLRYFYGGMKEVFAKHSREMKTIRNYMYSRKQKNPFEKLYLEYYEYFAAQAARAEKRLESSRGYGLLLEEACQERSLCHGDYHQHNVLFLKNDSKSQHIATVNFKMTINIQINDLYLFLRKVMEKNQWNTRLALDIVRSYHNENNMSGDEREYLYTLMVYPEKFWKIANHYYNTRKSWTSARNQEKLEAFAANCGLRENFLKEFGDGLADF